MNQEILELKKQLKQLRAALILVVALVFMWALLAFDQPKNQFNIIRARGIILEDSAGRDRILLGAPIPFSKDRVRTDTQQVRKHWAGTFEDQADQYMTWYKNYYHGANGMVVMNDSGFDRVLVGDKLADPNTGRRMFEPAGILWNNQQGWELGGAGVNSLKDGRARSIIGVDGAGGEAVHLVALEDGSRGLVISHDDGGKFLIGISTGKGGLFKRRTPFVGIQYYDSLGKLGWEQQVHPPKR